MKLNYWLKWHIKRVARLTRRLNGMKLWFQTSWSAFVSKSTLQASGWLEEQTLSLPVLASSENAADGVGEASSISLLSSVPLQFSLSAKTLRTDYIQRKIYRFNYYNLDRNAPIY